MLRYFFLLLPSFAFAQFSQQEVAIWKQQAQQVTIIRDNWGIPHIYGKTDADAVFGLMYAQCEDNFSGVEKNYLSFLGRLSETEGKDQLYMDLQMRLIYDSTDAIKDYQHSPLWLKKLLEAFAAGTNYYLATHPTVKPLVLQKFQPWYPLMFTDGGIASTETGGLRTEDIIRLYGKNGEEKTAWQQPMPLFETNPGGSNGFAVGPSKTASGNAILYINPHVTFYFRTEAQMVSEEGLNVYGAVTWGQFFVFQGFNQHCGWMHTTGYTDVADLYKEKTTQKGDDWFYTYDGKLLPVTARPATIFYKENGNWQHQTFTIYATAQHGPVVGSRNGQWLSLKAVNHSLNGLMQSWLRTKADGFESFKKIMDLRTNISNNTMFADDKGNIAYWHGNAIARRDTSFDFSQPVDGSISNTNWKGLHTVDETVHLYNPPNGWLQSCNSTPFAVAGENSPHAENYPLYMAPDGQNARSVNVIRLLKSKNGLTIDRFIHEIGYNHYLAAFDILLPSLFKAYNQLADASLQKQQLREPIGLLQKWNKESDTASVATTIATTWAEMLMKEQKTSNHPYYASHVIEQLKAAANNTPLPQQLQLLSIALANLEKSFGTWKVAWGSINRYQRITNNIFDDAQPSMAVGFAGSNWGSLPAFGTTSDKSTNKKYGTFGNSFVACVEFGKRLKAKSIVTGGQSFDPASPHFTDQAPGYVNGNFKDVLFYKEDVLQHVEKQYHPGE